MDQVVLRPFNPSLRGQVNGHYRAYAATSAIAPAANAVLASVRWVAAAASAVAPGSSISEASQPQVMVPLRITAQVTVVTAVTAQRQDPLACIVQRAYAASETTNAAAFTLAGNNGKSQTSFSTSQFVTAGQMAVANAAAGISGGTSSADTQAFGVAGLPVALVGLGSATSTLDLYRADVIHHEHPLVLATNEGFKVQWGATALATGTVVVTIGIEWMEVPTY
jgi:hypothetical protein